LLKILGVKQVLTLGLKGAGPRRTEDAATLMGKLPMRLAAALVLLIFAIMATSVAGTGAARSEMLSPVTVTVALANY
jgi:hypothetical protein